MKDPEPIPVRLITHNIRYATKSPFPGEQVWTERRRGLISQLRYHTRDSSSSPFICLQEVLHEQLEDIHAGLNAPTPDQDAENFGSTRTRSQAKIYADNDKWAYIGVGRDDGKEAGEYSPIFYRKSDWTLLENSTVWLSETPSKPSKSWDAASIRILTVGIFKHNESRKIVLALNTHLDDQGSKSRSESAKIILKVLRQFVVQGRRFDINGAFLAGDLNSAAGADAYTILNAEGSGLRDLRTLVPGLSNQPPILPSTGDFTSEAKSQKPNSPPLNPTSNPIQEAAGTDYYGNEYTFTGFGEKDTKPTRIDFIHLETADLVREKEEKWNMNAGSSRGNGSRSNNDNDNDNKSEKSPWLVQGYSVLPNKFDDDLWISDHRAVVGDLLLR